MFNRKKGEMGIGTLIIFIALLLVAAVAAGVLIQTTGSMQEKALTTGQQAKAQIATNAVVVEVAATNGQDSEVEFFTMIMKLAPGSDQIQLADAILTVNTFNATSTLGLQEAASPTNTHNSATGYNTIGESGNFTVEYLQTGSNSIVGTLQRGDVIKIYFEAPRNVSEAEEMRLNFIPKIGTPTMTQFVTPEVMSTKQVYLYP